MVVVPARMAHLLDRKLGDYRLNVRGADAQLDRTLTELHEVGAWYRAHRQAEPAPSVSRSGRSETVDAAAVVSSDRDLLTPREAGELMGLTARRIRQLVDDGALPPAKTHPLLVVREDVLDLIDRREDDTMHRWTPEAGAA